MRKKNFKMGVGKYFFCIKNGQSSIMISRNTRPEAETAFLSYKATKKDCEWLGCWNGKSYDDSTVPATQAA